MNDVLDRLRRAQPSMEPTPDSVISADVGRGRAALTRRRSRGTVVVTVASIVALTGGATVFGGRMGHAPTPVPSGDGTATASTVATPTATVVDPPTAEATASATEPTPTSPDPIWNKGPGWDAFTVTSIPEGLVVQGSNETALVLSRASSTTDPSDFADKLVVVFEDPYSPPGRYRGRPVSINGQPGAIDRDDENTSPGHDGDATTLEFQVGPYDILVQAWGSLGLSDAELITFAEGIGVTPAAVTPTRNPTPQTIETTELDAKTYLTRDCFPNCSD